MVSIVYYYLITKFKKQVFKMFSKQVLKILWKVFLLKTFEIYKTL